MFFQFIGKIIFYYPQAMLFIELNLMMSSTKFFFYEKIVLNDNVQDIIFSKKMKAFIFTSQNKLLILRKKYD